MGVISATIFVWVKIFLEGTYIFIYRLYFYMVPMLS